MTVTARKFWLRSIRKGEDDHAFVEELFAAFDRSDFATAQKVFGADAQAVDDISRRWLRTQEEIGRYFQQLASANTAAALGVTRRDTGFVTCWLEQDYVLDIQPQHIPAPTTIVLRRLGDGWRRVLTHSIPLPDGTRG